MAYIYGIEIKETYWGVVMGLNEVAIILFIVTILIYQIMRNKTR